MSTTEVGIPVPAVQRSVTKRRGGFLQNYFYFAMALLIPAIVVFGFSFTIGRNLIHPAIPRPTILYVHAAVFSGWLVFFLLQSSLVRTRNVQVHRSIGWFGAVFGALIPVIGVATAIAMGRFDIHALQQKHVEMDLMIPLWDMVVFATAFGLAIYWRGKPEYHRRLVYVATCALTAAAFGRFPTYLLNPNFFYAEYLVETKRPDEAVPYLERALQAPARPGREIADAGRREEARALLERVRAK